MKFQSPDKHSGNISQFKAENFLKQQAYKLEECSIQINHMMKDQLDNNSMTVSFGMDWSDSFSEADES